MGIDTGDGNFTTDGAARAYVGLFILPDGGLAIDEDVGDTERELARLVVGRRLGDALWIEQCQVRVGARSDDAAISEADDLGGKRRTLADRFFERHQAEVAGVVTENARVGAVGARVRLTAHQAVRARCEPGRGHQRLHVLLVHQMMHHADRVVVLDQ